MLIYKGLSRIFTHEDIDKLKHLIEHDYDETATSSNTNFSYRLEKYLVGTGMADLFEIINCCLTFMVIIFYIISTYTIPDKDVPSYKTINTLIDTIQIFLCVYFIAHFAAKLYTSQNRLYYLFSFDTIIDCGTVIPILISKQAFISD